MELFFKRVKQALLLEIKNYEENHKAARMDRPSGLGEFDQQQMGIIPVSSQHVLIFSFLLSLRSDT